MTELLVGHDFSARAYCDLDLQGSDQIVARDTSSQYCDHFCEIVKKSDPKFQSFWPDTTLLQGRAVTLTFRVGTHICARHVDSTWWSFPLNNKKTDFK